jgi:hypothetical protein
MQREALGPFAAEHSARWESSSSSDVRASLGRGEGLEPAHYRPCCERLVQETLVGGN